MLHPRKHDADTACIPDIPRELEVEATKSAIRKKGFYSRNLSLRGRDYMILFIPLKLF